MGRRNPLTGKLTENWKETVSNEIERRFSDVNSAGSKKTYLRILEHESTVDAVKRMSVAAGGKGLQPRIILDAMGECKKSLSRSWPPPEPILKKDIADLKRIQRKIKNLISFGVQPEFFGLYGRNVSLPRRTFTDEQILECMAMAEATLRYTASVQTKRNVGKPSDPRKRDLAANLEKLFRVNLHAPVFGAIGDWIKAAFDDKTKWPAERVKDLLKK
ncbi:MAG: hypothetical protein M1377_00285 [Deltaproteobacteria bacterium]|nr:hypothetical protein [Deltaproteobacteria bacterium]